MAAGINVNAKDDEGVTALHDAVLMIGDRKVVELLISEGANVNAESNGGVTPLFDAAFRGRLEISKILINKGAKVNSLDM